MKGVSPLVATVMLIVIVVSIVALMSGWLTDFFMGTRETVSNRTATSVDCTGAIMTIDAVYLQNGTFPMGKANVVVRNEGLVDDLAITSAVLYNTTGHNFSAATVLPIINLDRGGVATIYFENLSINENCTAFSRVVVTNQCGADTFKGAPTECVKG